MHYGGVQGEVHGCTTNNTSTIVARQFCSRERVGFGAVEHVIFTEECSPFRCVRRHADHGRQLMSRGFAQ